MVREQERRREGGSRAASRRRQPAACESSGPGARPERMPARQAAVVVRRAPQVDPVVWHGYSAATVEYRANEAGLDLITHQGEWLAETFAMQDAASLQFRVLAHPGADLEVMVVWCCTAASAAEARRAVRDFAAASLSASAMLQPALQLVPVTDRAQVTRVLNRVHRRSEFVEIGLPVATSGYLELPVWTPVRSSLHQLLRALSSESRRLNRDLEVISTLEVAPDAARVARAVESCLEESAVSRRSPWALPWGPGSEIFLRAQVVFAARGARPSDATVAAAISESTVAGRPPAGARAFTAELVAKPRERGALALALREGRVCDWRSVHAPSRPAVAPERMRTLSRDARYLADVRGAVAIARLPVPMSMTLPCVPMRSDTEVWLGERPPRTNNLLIGDNTLRNHRQPVGISERDLRSHVYVVGATGTGKSTTVKNLLVQAIRDGRGVAVIDPHGDLVTELYQYIPPGRVDDVVSFDPARADRPVGFNFMDCDEENRPHVIEDFIATLYSLYDPTRQGIIGPRFETAVRNAMHLAMAHPKQTPTLIEVVRLLIEPGQVNRYLKYVDDPMVKAYWSEQIPRTNDFHRSEVLDYVASKFSKFIGDPRVRRIIGQPESSFSIREIMDERKILLVNLSRGRIGEEASRFLGMTLMSMLTQAAFSRAELPAHERDTFVVAVDEFQLLNCASFGTLLSGARKYGISMLLAHQNTHQLPPELAETVFGNVGSMISFRLGIQDAPLVASAMSPSAFTTQDFVRLPNYRGIATVLQDGIRTPAFSLATYPDPVPELADAGWADLVRSRAEERYGRPRIEVDAMIQERFE